MLSAYHAGDAKKFNQDVAAYQHAVAPIIASQVDLSKVQFESFFNQFAPFYWCSVLYLVAFVLTCLSWLGWSKPLSRSAFWLMCFTLVVHTFAIWSRIHISGRPPVTNLYSSAVFIGWAAVALGLILERMYKLGVGNIVAAVAGFITLGIAHFLAGDGDTFTVLQAVLDTQFWLATHVVCITLGYATTYVAGLLGLIYVIRGVLTPSLTPRIGQNLTRMTYGALCFAIFFSFIGTVLGGLWADDSWGRFWGWDPKENGALIIVLWNALVLHARWDGMVKDRGLAVLAVLGNIAVSWSWFGVNELGIGLHSYGFTEGVLLTLGAFCASQLVVAGLGVLPKDWWWSARREQVAGS
ncbi:MAG: cytochrome c biogenesis protein CcsA [Planctomycetaceae bacterium]